MILNIASIIQFLLVMWCGMTGEASNNNLDYKPAPTAPSSMILHLEVSHKLDANLTELKRMTAIQPDRYFDDKFYYSLDEKIYSKNQTQQKSKWILTADEAIESFQQISKESFLVREKSTLKVYSTGEKDNKTFDLAGSFCNNHPNQSILNCSQPNSITFGPTAVDSAYNLVYFTAASTIYQVNLSENFSTTTFQLTSSLGNISAMALNNNFSGAYTIQGSANVTVSHVDFLRLEVTSVNLKGNPNKILQAVSVGEKALLCKTVAQEMLLLNTDTGDYTMVAEGMTNLPCNHSDCGQKQMRVKALADHQIRGKDLYAIEPEQGPIIIKYNVSIFYHDDDKAVSSDNGSTYTGVIVGSSVGAVVLCVFGIALTVFCLRARKMKRGTPNKTTLRTHRNAPHSVNTIEDIELSSFNRQAEDAGTTGIEESRAETSEERSERVRIFKDRPLPPLPQSRESTVQVHRAQSGASESDDYCYADVREYYKEGSLTRTPAVRDERPPIEPRRFRPRLSLPKLDQEGEQINSPSPSCENPSFLPDPDAEKYNHDMHETNQSGSYYENQGSIYNRSQTTPPRPRPRLSLQTARQRNIPKDDSSPYSDNPSYLPIPEALEYDCKLSVIQQNEPYYVEVLGHSDQSAITPVLVHGKPPNMVLNPTQKFTLPTSNHREEQMETQEVLSENQTLPPNSDVPEYAHDVYITDQRETLAPKEPLDVAAKEESKAMQASQQRSNIFVTVISDKMELKMHTNFEQQTSTVTVLARDP